jgi:alpha-tubulin suppressor-like RCC1 family protein
VRVTGGRTLIAISTGGTHSCALAADGTAYCWGNNTWGQLGDSSTVSRVAPARVRNAPPFASLAAGTDHTCGLTAAAIAFCWGRNESGELGLGSEDSVPHPVPAPVVGGQSFVSLDAGQVSCGVTATGQAYCWGATLTAPTLVGGALTFRSVSVAFAPYSFNGTFAQYSVACSIATDARGYCWMSTGSPFPLVGPVQP